MRLFCYGTVFKGETVLVWKNHEAFGGSDPIELGKVKIKSKLADIKPFPELKQQNKDAMAKALDKKDWNGFELDLAKDMYRNLDEKDYPEALTNTKQYVLDNYLYDFKTKEGEVFTLAGLLEQDADLNAKIDGLLRQYLFKFGGVESHGSIQISSGDPAYFMEGRGKIGSFFFGSDYLIQHDLEEVVPNNAFDSDLDSAFDN